MYKGRRWLFFWSRLIVLVVAVLLARICGQSPLEAVCFLKAAKRLCRSAARPGVMDAWAVANAALESPDPPSDAPAQQPSVEERGPPTDGVVAWGAAAGGSVGRPEHEILVADAHGHTPYPVGVFEDLCSPTGASPNPRHTLCNTQAKARSSFPELRFLVNEQLVRGVGSRTLDRGRGYPSRGGGQGTILRTSLGARTGR